MAMFWNRLIYMLMLAVLLVGPSLFCAGCSGGQEVPTEENPVVVTAQIVPEAAEPGESVTLVWRFALADGWHLYWSGRNDTGYPPGIDLDLPEGWVAGGLQWPAPERYVSAGDILDHVYHDELVLIQKLGAPSNATVGLSVTIQAEVQWLACKDMCVPGRTSLSVAVPVSDRIRNREPNIASVAADRLPALVPDGILETGWEGATFHLSHPGAASLTFMPTGDCGPLVDLLNDGRGESLTLRFRPKRDTVGPVRGLISVEEESGNTRVYRVDFPAVPFAAATP